MTNYVIRFLKDANDDLTDILGWYKAQPSPSAQRNFIQEMSKTLKIIEKHLKSHAIRLKNVRCAVMKKYRYNIYYWEDDTAKEVNIFAILHQARDPDIWQDRVS